MVETSYLYLLVFAERGIIKIGKADDIHERIQALKRWWGEVDYEESYQLGAPRNIVFKLEQSLHFLLSSHAIEFERGDGRTELYSSKALDYAIKYIELFSSSRGEQTALRRRKGVKSSNIALL